MYLTLNNLFVVPPDTDVILNLSARASLNCVGKSSRTTKIIFSSIADCGVEGLVLMETLMNLSLRSTLLAVLPIGLAVPLQLAREVGVLSHGVVSNFVVVVVVVFPFAVF
eukprot:GEZU01012702.1.p1 GENE.GEZU01012702.1~~GEZU01012702.1.p1  ORF type:complete len:110 (-),score=5.21 GEZU01012702.1:123-452(-)